MQGGGVFRDWGAVQLCRLMEVDKSVRRETEKALQKQVIVNHEYQTKGF